MSRAVGIVAACIAAFVFVAFLWAPLTTVTYRSTASILLDSQVAADIFEPAPGTTDPPEAQQQAVDLLLSPEVRAEAQSRLGFEANVTAHGSQDSDVMGVQALDEDPERARITAQTYAEAFLAAQTATTVEEQLQAASELLTRIEALDAQIAAVGPEGDASQLKELRDDLADSLDRLTLTAQREASGTARIIDDARSPTQPFAEESRTGANLIAGGVVGFMVALLGTSATLLWPAQRDEH